MPNLSESVEEPKAEPSLPTARVRIIMKSSSDPSVPLIKLETLHLVSKATEMLIKTLAKESIGKNKTLEYKHVADYVQSDNKLEFLHSILPKKITGKAFMKLLNETDDSDKSDNSDESDSSSSSSSEDDELSSSDSGDSAVADSQKEEPEKTEKKK
ncbi:chromatin accessibility complex 16kD protein [Bradysia coprophila]|uniref:chromatin accessibility complex 16kD protein n=1 Tax=Bradysia coprophila TaxID=38358 RepID=UPI00187DBF4F|nr:chromatin accessibility complex 16kD protein [Bradysia coprophila]